MAIEARPPAVSVIIPVRDRPALIADCLQSLLAQDFQDWEAVVVDDGSTDTTPAVLQSFAEADPRIRLFATEPEHRGPSNARNLGFAASRADFVMFFDSDDLLESDCLRVREAALRRYRELDCVVFQGSGFKLCKGDSPYHPSLRRPLLAGVADLDAFLAHQDPWLTHGPLWRRAAFARFGGWDAEVQLRVDLQLHTKCLLRGLRYKSFWTADHHLRDHNAVRISSQNTFSQLNRIRLVHCAMYQLLQLHGQVSTRNRHLLASAIFWDAVALATPRSLFASGDPRSCALLGLISELALLPRSCVRILVWVVRAQRLPVLHVIVREALRLPFINYLKRRCILDPRILSYSFLRLRLAVQRAFR